MNLSITNFNEALQFFKNLKSQAEQSEGQKKVESLFLQCMKNSENAQPVEATLGEKKVTIRNGKEACEFIRQVVEEFSSQGDATEWSSVIQSLVYVGDKDTVQEKMIGGVIKTVVEALKAKRQSQHFITKVKVAAFDGMDSKWLSAVSGGQAVDITQKKSSVTSLPENAVEAVRSIHEVFEGGHQAQFHQMAHTDFQKALVDMVGIQHNDNSDERAIRVSASSQNVLKSAAACIVAFGDGYTFNSINRKVIKSALGQLPVEEASAQHIATLLTKVNVSQEILEKYLSLLDASTKVQILIDSPERVASMICSSTGEERKKLIEAVRAYFIREIYKEQTSPASWPRFDTLLNSPMMTGLQLVPGISLVPSSLGAYSAVVSARETVPLQKSLADKLGKMIDAFYDKGIDRSPLTSLYWRESTSKVRVLTKGIFAVWSVASAVTLLQSLRRDDSSYKEVAMNHLRASFVPLIVAFGFQICSPRVVRYINDSLAYLGNAIGYNSLKRLSPNLYEPVVTGAQVSTTWGVSFLTTDFPHKFESITNKVWAWLNRPTKQDIPVQQNDEAYVAQAEYLEKYVGEAEFAEQSTTDTCPIPTTESVREGFAVSEASRKLLESVGTSDKNVAAAIQAMQKHTYEYVHSSIFSLVYKDISSLSALKNPQSELNTLCGEIRALSVQKNKDIQMYQKLIEKMTLLKDMKFLAQETISKVLDTFKDSSEELADTVRQELNEEATSMMDSVIQVGEESIRTIDLLTEQQSVATDCAETVRRSEECLKTDKDCYAAYEEVRKAEENLDTFDAVCTYIRKECGAFVKDRKNKLFEVAEKIRGNLIGPAKKELNKAIAEENPQPQKVLEALTKVEKICSGSTQYSKKEAETIDNGRKDFIEMVVQTVSSGGKVVQELLDKARKEPTAKNVLEYMNTHNDLAEKAQKLCGGVEVCTQKLNKWIGLNGDVLKKISVKEAVDACWLEQVGDVPILEKVVLLERSLRADLTTITTKKEALSFRELQNFVEKIDTLEGIVNEQPASSAEKGLEAEVSAELQSRMQREFAKGKYQELINRAKDLVKAKLTYALSLEVDLPEEIFKGVEEVITLYGKGDWVGALKKLEKCNTLQKRDTGTLASEELSQLVFDAKLKAQADVYSSFSSLYKLLLTIRQMTHKESESWLSSWTDKLFGGAPLPLEKSLEELANNIGPIREMYSQSRMAPDRPGLYTPKKMGGLVKDAIKETFKLQLPELKPDETVSTVTIEKNIAKLRSFGETIQGRDFLSRFIEVKDAAYSSVGKLMSSCIKAFENGDSESGWNTLFQVGKYIKEIIKIREDLTSKRF